MSTNETRIFADVSNWTDDKIRLEAVAILPTMLAFLMVPGYHSLGLITVIFADQAELSAFALKIGLPADQWTHQSLALHPGATTVHFTQPQLLHHKAVLDNFLAEQARLEKFKTAMILNHPINAFDAIKHASLGLAFATAADLLHEWMRRYFNLTSANIMTIQKDLELLTFEPKTGMHTFLAIIKGLYSNLARGNAQITEQQQVLKILHKVELNPEVGPRFSPHIVQFRAQHLVANTATVNLAAEMLVMMENVIGIGQDISDVVCNVFDHSGINNNKKYDRANKNNCCQANNIQNIPIMSSSPPTYKKQKFSTSIQISNHQGNPDTGTTGNYITMHDMSILKDVRATRFGIKVKMPNGTVIKSTHVGLLPNEMIPLEARLCHIFPELTSESLISIGMLCDAGCEAKYTKDKVVITLGDEVIYQGGRSTDTRMWHIDLAQPTANNAANNVIRLDSEAEFVRFCHATYGSPAVSTFIQSVTKGFVRIPGLTAAAIRRHPPNTMATAKGHLNQTRQGQRSTKTREVCDPSDEEDFHPTPSKIISYKIICKLVGRTLTNFSDLTGRFPVQAINGDSYMLVMYSEGANYIHIETMPNRSSEEYVKSFQRGYKFFADHGFKPEFERLDNEISADLIAFFATEKIGYQLSPPGMHRANKAERAIQTWKQHFISVLSTTDKDFPLNLWSELVPAGECTLNQMRSSGMTPNISAWDQMHGPYDFSKNPMVAAGMKVLCHNKPSQRGTWAAHGEPGFYLGAARKHYRSYDLWITRTKSHRVSDTVEWFPSDIRIPGASVAEEIARATQELTAAIKAACDSNATLLHQRVPLNNLYGQLSTSLRELRDIYNPPAVENETSIQRVPSLPTSAPQTVLPVIPEIQKFSPVQRVVATPTIEPSISVSSDLAAQKESPVPYGGNNSTYEIHFKQLEKQQRSPSALSAAPNVAAIRSSARTTKGQPPKHLRASKVTATHTQQQFNNKLIDAAIIQADRERKINIVVPATTKRRHKRRWKNPPTGTRIPQNHASRVQSSTAEEEVARLVAIFEQDMTDAAEKIKTCCAAVDQFIELQAKSHGLTRAEYHFAGSATSPVTGLPLRYQQLITGVDSADWVKELIVEWERLLSGTHTAEFIHATDKPKDRVASYFNPICSIKIKPEEPEGVKRRVRGTYGGNITDHIGAVTAEVADMATVKILFNAVVSEPNAYFSTADIKDFYLNTELERPEYMWAQLSDIPKFIQIKYNVEKFAVNGRVMVKLKKGIYGLPQAGLLARKRLVAHLSKHDYHEDKDTHGFFKHLTRPVSFTLVVDDFGIKCSVAGREHVQHLHDALRELYEITIDWSGTKYIGYTLKWDLNVDKAERKVTLSMPGYVSKALARFNVQKARHDTNSPGPYSPPVYGASTQKATAPDTSPLLSPERKKRIEEIVGVFLYYARALDCTMLHKVGQLGSEQAKPTENLEKAAEYFMQYAATWPDATIVYRASEMVLHAQGDGSYLSETKARSRAAGFIYLGGRTRNDGKLQLINGLISVFSTILRLVVCSAAEVEYGATFLTGRELMVMRRTCNSMGFPQPTNDIQTDNACAAGIANDTINQKLSKAMDMRYEWVRDQVREGILSVTWRRGEDNLADFFTINHPSKTHLAGRRFFVVDPPSLDPNKNTRTRKAANS